MNMQRLYSGTHTLYEKALPKKKKMVKKKKVVKKKPEINIPVIDEPRPFCDQPSSIVIQHSRLNSPGGASMFFNRFSDRSE